VVEVETRREHGAGAAENHRTVAELSFEAIECGMKVREKDGVCALTLFVFIVTTATWSCLRSIVHGMSILLHGL